jgi:hypothetical protein
MASLVLTGDTSGQVTLAAPAVAGTSTITLAAQTGTLNVAGPAFSAYPNATLSVANSTATKILFQTEEFDTNNNFASSTFTPTVAGYYQLSTLIGASGTLIATEATIAIYKNGSAYKYLADPYAASISMLGGSCLVYANGTTDYFEVYLQQFSGSSRTISSASTTTWFQGCLMRGA